MATVKISPQGWSVDQLAEELPQDVLTELQNMHYHNGRMQQVQGYAAYSGALSGAPRYLVPNQEAGNAYWIYVANGAVYVTDGTTHWTITWAGMSDHTTLAAPFTGGLVNQLPFVNSAQDGPFGWDQNTANPMTMLTDWGASDRCAAMRPFREFLIAMNIFTGGTRFQDLLRWSDAAPNGSLPVSWTAGVGSQAGEVSVAFNAGALVDGRQLLDRFLVYKTTSTYLLQLVGGTFVFNQRPIFSTVGALATDCVEEYRGQHLVLTDGDLVRHDSLTVQSMIKDKLRDEIFGEMDTENFENSYLALDKTEGHLFVCRPRVGETYPSEAIIVALQDGSHLGHRTLPTACPHMIQGLVNVAAAGTGSKWSTKTTKWSTDGTRWFSGAFTRNANYVVAADFTNSKLQQFGEAADLDGAVLATVLERRHLDLGDPTVRKYVRAIRPRINGSLGSVVSVQLGYADDPNREPTWTTAQNFTVGTTRELTFKKVQGRYISYRLTSSSILSWGLPDLQVDFEPMGMH